MLFSFTKKVQKQQKSMMQLSRATVIKILFKNDLIFI